MNKYDSKLPLKAAVIGTGYLGKFHAQKYTMLEGCELTAIVDRNIDTAKKIADENQTNATTDYQALLGNVDLVSIATPTQTHFEIARDFLNQGSHVLIEKPISVTVQEAETLIDIAENNNLVLQVGHLERFNTALREVEHRLQEPRFIESHRLAPFTPRGTDVNVVLDLMIHDIDIILNIVNADVVHIDASGAAIISEAIDIANARIRFTNGCVANVTASRVSDKQERKMRFFQKNSYVAIDFQENRTRVCETGKVNLKTGIPEIKCTNKSLKKGDAILEEIMAFCRAIHTQTSPVVSGRDGKRALETAIAISDQLAKN